MLNKIRDILIKIWVRIPFGYLLRFKNGKETITLNKDLWVIVSDGRSSDALPLNLCSQELVDNITERLEKKYKLSKPSE